jgi:hypothetical protein
MTTMDRLETGPEPLTCVRDNQPVSSDEPQCPHPSSVCPFRELCEVKDAIRRKRRGQEGRPSA